jgi:uncharacterized repeat protein (TIGR04138 family)
MYQPKLEEIIRRDPRYPLEAYEFVRAALKHTERMLGQDPLANELAQAEFHVSGQQLLEGIRDLALREFGMLARTVFRMWGVQRTGDFGQIVFNLIEIGLMSKTDQDDLRDFEDVYDLDEALGGYRIEIPQEAEEA